MLFDMDGVLISSIGSVVRCWRRWAKMYGIPDAETYEVPHGMRAIDIVQSLKPDIDPEEGLRVIEDMEIEDTADLIVLPGVKALLESLPVERWAIVTSATRRIAAGQAGGGGIAGAGADYQRRYGGAGQARSGAVPARGGAAGVRAGGVRGGGGCAVGCGRGVGGGLPGAGGAGDA